MGCPQAQQARAKPICHFDQSQSPIPQAFRISSLI